MCQSENIKDTLDGDLAEEKKAPRFITKTMQHFQTSWQKHMVLLVYITIDRVVASVLHTSLDYHLCYSAS